MAEHLRDDPERLRAGVRANYRAVAADPRTIDYFHTGRHLAARLGYDAAIIDALPDQAVESFTGVANPFSLRNLTTRVTRGVHQVQTPMSPWARR